MEARSPSRTSVSLLARLRGETLDPAAWATFVHRYGPVIHSWCRRWHVQDADAEDITQEVLLQISRKMPSFVYDPTRSFRAWLKTLTHAAWCSWLEGRKRPGQGSGDSNVRDQLETVEARTDLLERLQNEYDSELLDEAMSLVRGRVEPQTWQAFHLQAVEGLSGAETAARLGIKRGTAFVARGRVQKMIQEEVSRLDGGD